MSPTIRRFTGADPTPPRGRVTCGGKRPPHAPRATRGDLRSQPHVLPGRVGPARDDADARRSGARGGDRDARPARPREVRRRRHRQAAREAPVARGVARVRLGRREPDSGDAARLGEGQAGPVGSPSGDAPGGSPGSPDLGRRTREQRLLRVPADARAEPRPQEALRRVLRVGRLPVHAAARRLRAVHEDDRGGGSVRHDSAGAGRARARGASRSRRRSSTSRIRRSSSASSPSASSRRWGSGKAPGGSTRPCTPSVRRSHRATSASRRATARPGSSRSGRPCTRRATACTPTASPHRSSGLRSRVPRRSG